jgi:hypothetical protein
MHREPGILNRAYAKRPKSVKLNPVKPTQEWSVGKSRCEPRRCVFPQLVVWDFWRDFARAREKIYLQPAKNKIFCKYVRYMYLGMVVGNNCLLEDPAKIRAIVDMPEPKNYQTEIRGF